MARVVVLGAGPAGLAAAFRLARRGHEVTVLERNDAVGGLAASFDVAGVRVDHGSHRLHPSTPPEILGELGELLGDDLQWRRRDGRILVGDRLVGFPLSPMRALGELPPRLGAAVLRDVAAGPFRRPRGDSFADVARARVGPTLATEVYEPFARKIWGAPGHALAGELARRRIGTRGSADLLRRALGRAPGGGGFWYPRRGFGQIAEALADAAAAAGADIRCGAEVQRIVVERGSVIVRSASLGELDFDVCLSSIPLPVLARLVGAPPDVNAAAMTLEYRGLVLLYMVLEREYWTRFDAHYFPDQSVAASRVSEPKRYRSSRDDRSDVTVLCAEVPCGVGDELWSAEPDVLAALLGEQLSRVGLPAVEAVEVVSRQVVNAYPVYRPGFEVDLAVVEGWAEGLDRVLAFGRQGLFAHDNTHHTLATARIGADCVRGDGSIDWARWSDARRHFADHVVED